MSSPVAIQYDDGKIAVAVLGTDRAAWVCMGSDDNTFSWVKVGGFL